MEKPRLSSEGHICVFQLSALGGGNDQNHEKSNLWLLPWARGMEPPPPRSTTPISFQPHRSTPVPWLQWGWDGGLEAAPQARHRLSRAERRAAGTAGHPHSSPWGLSSPETGMSIPAGGSCGGAALGPGLGSGCHDVAELQGNAGEGAIEKVQGTQVAHGHPHHKQARLACFCTTSTVGVFSAIRGAHAASGTQMHLLLWLWVTPHLLS